MVTTENNNGFWTRVEKASSSPSGDKLITFVIRMPKFLVAQFNTHRMISRNSASTRAIPIASQLNRDIYFPPTLYKNQKVMAGSELLSEEDYTDLTNKLI